MEKKCRFFKPLLLLIIFLVLIVLLLVFANLIQKDFGKVNVTMGTLETEKGDLTYKLYSPKSATKENRAPGVLLLHGYQNDHETSAAFAIELARRGAVVLALDEYGHGTSEPGMIERGYTNHKVTVNYGEDEYGKTYLEIGGQKRYRVMMNFSNLSFFNDYYSKGTDGSEVNDSAMGGIEAYAYLATLENVDPTRLSVSGHSMGTWASWSVSALYAGATNEKGEDITPKATVLQCGELFKEDVYNEKKSLFGSDIYFNNVLLLQAKYDEFSYFRDYKKTVTDDLLKTPLRSEFLGTSNGEWNTTYGNFSDGSARKIELLYTNHRLTTHNKTAIATTIEWLGDAVGLSQSPSPRSQVAMIKETLVFLVMLLSIAAMIPLFEILSKLKFFSYTTKASTLSLRERSGWKWWRGAIITILIAAFTYPFMTQLGHGLLPLPEGIFRMTIGNGFVSWYLLLIIIMLLTTIIPYKKAKKRGEERTFVDLGLSSDVSKKGIDWLLCGKSVLLGGALVIFMYLITLFAEKAFMLDLRFIWPFFKTFTGKRFLQFLVYFPIFFIFFLLNNSKIFAQGRIKDTSKSGFKGFVSVWWRYALCMVGGILLIILIEYIPFFMGFGPGADLLFGSTFGGPFMSLLIVFAPQVVVFSVLCTYFYRKTGSVYVGATVVSALAAWIVTGGSAILL